MTWPQPDKGSQKNYDKTNKAEFKRFVKSGGTVFFIRLKGYELLRNFYGDPKTYYKEIKKYDTKYIMMPRFLYNNVQELIMRKEISLIYLSNFDFIVSF